MDAKQLSVSVIIPAYNREALIVPTLESVVGQTVSPLEVIVVDDCSTDRTIEVVRKFAEGQQGIPISCMVQEENQGVSAARNRGIREACGEWIAFLDSDDMWESGHLEGLAERQAVSRADFVFSCARGFSDEDPSAVTKCWGTRFGSAQEVVHYLIQGCHILPSAAMVRREELLRAGLFDEAPEIQHAEDLDLWLTLAEKGLVFEMSHEETCLYRQHSLSACGNKVRLYKAGLHCLAKHRNGRLNTRSEWRQAYAYYCGKLARALWPEDRAGAREVIWCAARHQPLFPAYWGGVLVMSTVGMIEAGRTLVGRYCARFL